MAVAERLQGSSRARGQSVGRLVARFEAKQGPTGEARTPRATESAHPLAAIFARWWRACQPSASGLGRGSSPRSAPPRGIRRGVGPPRRGPHLALLEAGQTAANELQLPPTFGIDLVRGSSTKNLAPEKEKLGEPSPVSADASTSATSTGTPPSGGPGLEGSSASESDVAKAPQWLIASARAFLAARGVPCRAGKTKAAEPAAASYRLDSDTEGSDAELSEWRRGAKDVLAAAKLLVREVRLSESWSAGSARQLPDFFAADVADELWATPPGARGASRRSTQVSEDTGQPAPAWASRSEEQEPGAEASAEEVLAELEAERRARLDCVSELREVQEQRALLRLEVEQLSLYADQLRSELQVAQDQLPELVRKRQELLKALQEREAVSPDAELQLALASTTAAVHELRQRLSNSEAAKRQLQQRCERLEAREQSQRPEMQRASQLQLLLQEEQQLRQNLEEEVAALRSARSGEPLPEAVLSAADLANHLKQGSCPQGARSPEHVRGLT